MNEAEDGDNEAYCITPTKNTGKYLYPPSIKYEIT